MTSLRPYLIRAVYDWILDNSMTPYLLVDAEAEGAMVPTAYVHEGRIVLNLRPEAVQALSLGDQQIEFSARFGGKPMSVSLPVTAVLAIYAKENGRGMVFEHEEGEETPPNPPPEPPAGPVKKSKPSRPVLTVVK